MTCEDDSFGAAGDVDAAAGAKPAMAESRGGPFGEGEQNAPSSSSRSSSSRNNSSYSSGTSRKPSSKSSSNSSSSHDGIPAGDLAATLPKGEARRLYSWTIGNLTVSDERREPEPSRGTCIGFFACPSGSNGEAGGGDKF